MRRTRLRRCGEPVRTVVRAARPPAPSVAPSEGVGTGGDAGFTLVELIVAITIVTIVASAGSTFFVSSLSAVRVQGAAQTAAQVADDAMGVVRRMSPAALLVGRDQTSVDTQWTNPAPGVDLSAAQIQKAYDSS